MLVGRPGVDTAPNAGVDDLLASSVKVFHDRVTPNNGHVTLAAAMAASSPKKCWSTATAAPVSAQ